MGHKRHARTDEMLASLRQETVATWFDLGLFLDRLREDRPGLTCRAPADLPAFERDVAAGVLTLIAVYLAVVFRGLYIASQAQDSYARLLAGSLVLTFFVYIFVNIGMVSGILPVVGLPLPLLSYGGTSLVTVMATFGILMSVHTHRRLISG